MALLVAFGSELTWFVEVSSLHSSVGIVNYVHFCRKNVLNDLEEFELAGIFFFAVFALALAL